jgi:hypothetical protein
MMRTGTRPTVLRQKVDIGSEGYGEIRPETHTHTRAWRASLLRNAGQGAPFTFYKYPKPGPMSQAELCDLQVNF